MINNLNKTEIMKLRKCNECYVMGRLAEEYEYDVTLMNNSLDKNILFHLKPISKEPTPIIEYLNGRYSEERKHDYYIGIDIHQWDVLTSDEYLSMDVEDKINYIREKLHNRAILFKPVINFTKDKKAYKNLKLISIEKEFKDGNIPEYETILNIDNFKSIFEEQLLESKIINANDYPEYMESVKYIICEDYIYWGFSSWETDKRSLGIVHKGSGVVKKTKIESLKNFEDRVVPINDKIFFIEKDFIRNFINSNPCENLIKGAEEDEFSLEATLDIAPRVVEEYHEENIENMKSEENSDAAENYNSEYEFLEDLKKYAIKQGLCYSFEDLVNFHVSLKTNPLTILSGMSGMGKTQLALCYAEVLGLMKEDDNRVLILPISPSYTEPCDILGYLNNSTGSYMPSDTGFVDFLIQASQNKDKIYMVIFEEMNLSQVEYWFAPFISLLELNEDQRKLRLYSDKSVCSNAEAYPSVLPIGENVFFVGTVNMDETTKAFSDRFLDRANLITLKKKSFLEFKKEQKEDNKNEKLQCIGSRENYIKDYLNWINAGSALDAFSEEYLKFLDELHELIQSYDDQKGISFRTIENIGKYINNIPLNYNGEATINKEEAIDIQIKQRIFTKLRGSAEQLEGLIGTTTGFNGEIKNSALYDLLNSEMGKGISPFKLCKKELSLKARELSLYGYTN